MARKFLALIVIVVPLTLAACGSDSSSSSTTTPEATTTAESESNAASTTASGGGGGESVDVSETEYKLTPADSTVKAGSVTLNASNDGSTTHNLVIEGNGLEEQTTDDLSPGQSGTLNVDLKPGTYEIYCSIDGHKDLGMEGSITVQ